MGSVLDTVAPIAAAVAATTLGQPELAPYAAAATSGGLNYSQTHNVGSALGTAAGSAIGSNIGGNLFPSSSSLGSVGGALGINPGSSIASGLGSIVGQGASNSLLGSSVGSIAGGLAGGSLGGQAGANLTPPKPPKPPAPPAPFSPSYAPAMTTPSSLSGMNNFSPSQQISSLATQGAYGGGLAPQEESYFANLLNHQLVDPNNSVNPISTLSPVENTYLSKIGLGGYGDSGSLLKALSTFNPAT